MTRRRSAPIAANRAADLAVLGFRVKSGKTIAVLLRGSVDEPRLLDACVVDLSDRRAIESFAPWHAAMELPESKAAATIRRLVKVVERSAARSLAKFCDEQRARGVLLARAAIVVGSVIDPATIANDHIRAHAEESRLFRTVVERAMREQRLAPVVHVEKELFAAGAAALGRTERALKRAVTALGATHDGRWRSEEKAAALAAWMVLADSA